MANNLSFGVAINLLTDKFKNGANQLKNEFRSIQMQSMTMFAALAGGAVSVTSFFDKLIDTAKKTNAANTALKNVSGTYEEFGKNQKFLIELSKKYGLNVNDLVGNFAKFTASASNANITLQNQYKIFESLSRASIAFGLSADQSNGVFLAVSQMMGKGKISAEELRGQLGERLPIAMQAMAKAAGVSVAGLDKIMKKGELMSADVLPKFADALNEMIPNVSTDTLNKSLGDLSNTFTDLTKKMNVEGIYKQVIDKLGEMFKWVIANFSTTAFYIVNIITTLIIGKGFNLLKTAYINLQNNAKAYYKMQAKLAGTSFDEAGFAANKFTKTMKFGFAALKASAISAFSAIAPLAIISAITAIIQKIVEWKKKQDDLKAIWGDYNKASKNASGTNDEIVKLKSLQSIMNNKLGKQKDINLAQQKLMSMLGLEKASQADINKKIEERINLLKNTAKANFYSNKLVETDNQINEVAGGTGLSTEAIQRLVSSYVNNNVQKNGMLSDGAKLFQSDIAKEVRLTGNKGVYDLDAIIYAVKQVGQLNKVKNDANKNLKDSIINSTSVNNNNNNNNNNNDTEQKLTPLQQVTTDYENQIKEYTNQLKNGVIKQNEYNKNVDELNKKTFEKLGGMLSPEEANKNDLYNKVKEGANNPLFTATDEINEKLNEAQEKYTTELNSITKKKELGLITEDKYNDELNNLINSTIDAVLSITNIGNGADEFVNKLKSLKIEKVKDYTPGTTSKRDTFFDYKKNNVEKTQEEIDNNNNDIKNYVDKFKDNGVNDIEQKIKNAGEDLNKLKAEFNGAADDLIDALSAAMKKDISLSEALKVQELKKDIKDLKKQLNTDLYAGVKNIANSAKNVYEGFNALKNTINDIDASGFEKFIALWDFMTNTVDSILSIIQLISNLTEVTKALGAAKKVEAGIDAITTGQKVTNATIGAAATATAATTETAANTAVAASGAAASVASVPIVGVGLAIGAVAAIIALLAGLPKFKNGGIVGGNSITGDKILARLNSGELILNQGQQGTLYGLLNNNSGGGKGGKVEFVIEGKNLKGVLSNFDNIKNKTK